MKNAAVFLAFGWVFIRSTGFAQFKIQSPAAQPRLALAMMQFEGAFRLPADDFGVLSMNYSEGPLAYDPTRNSIFIVGHNHQQALAEFAEPALVKSTKLAELNIAAAPLQNFVTVLDRAPSGNPQALDAIGGLGLIDGQLIVNAYEYYDEGGGNTHTTLIVRNPNDLASSTIAGFFAFQGGAGHTSGWLSPIPEAWRVCSAARISPANRAVNRLSVASVSGLPHSRSTRAISTAPTQ